MPPELDSPEPRMSDVVSNEAARDATGTNIYTCLDFGLALNVIERIDLADMATHYTTAADLLFPSHSDGFGLPVLEAQMCGTPVASSDRVALPEVAETGVSVAGSNAVYEITQRALQAIISTLHCDRPMHSTSSQRAEEYHDLYLEPKSAEDTNMTSEPDARIKEISGSDVK
jgi:glycosyltransferase involved in cell wall biosynthesis